MISICVCVTPPFSEFVVIVCKWLPAVPITFADLATAQDVQLLFPSAIEVTATSETKTTDEGRLKDAVRDREALVKAGQDTTLLDNAISIFDIYPNNLSLYNDKIKDSFLANYFDSATDNEIRNFQKFIQKNLLSSHMFVICTVA